MPHLPPVEIRGGSVTLKIPVEEVDAKGNPLQTLFKKGKREIETYPEAGKTYPEAGKNRARKQSDTKTAVKKYKVQSYSTTEEADSYIYLVEIHGEDEDEVFEFRPKDGKCTVRVYFATEDENQEVHDLMDERRWPNTVKQLFAEGKI